MEVIVELLLEGLIQLLLEGLFELGFRGIGKLLANRVVRWVLGTVIAASIAYGGGWWWGDRLASEGQTEMPTSFYVSIGLAAAFGALSIVRALRGPRTDTVNMSPGDRFDSPAESMRLLSPVHWSVRRLLGFCLVNVAVAIGINAGFTVETAVLR